MTDTLARTKVGLPHVFDPAVECPGGEPIAETVNGSGVRCRVEHSSILSDQDPKSLILWCCSEYRTCPTWQAEKDRIAEGRRAALVEA